MKIKYPLRPAELIGKKHLGYAGCVLDANHEKVRLCATYEEAETVALVMNHVHAVWEPRFKALERRREPIPKPSQRNK